jgi:hypothetical protein
VTFAPYYQTTWSGGGRVTLRFDATRVSGTRSKPGTADETIDAPLHRRAFSASVMNLLARCLPLRKGYRARLPLFADPQGNVEGEVEVLAEETVDVPSLGARLAWKVGLRVGESRATVWLDRVTGGELRTEAVLPGGRTMIQRPKA